MVMLWKYRLVRHLYEDGSEWYGVHEVFYNESGKPFTMTEKPEAVISDTPGEIREILRDMLISLAEPVLDAEKIDWAKWAENTPEAMKRHLKQADTDEESTEWPFLEQLM